MFRKKRKEEGAKYGDITLEPLILQNSRLKFSPEQLQNLNFVFNKKLQYRHDYLDKTLSQAKSVAERLIQRLLCAAGSADSRFASKFLIVDNSTSSHNDIFQKGLSYLVRLDELSTPCLYDLDSTPRLEIIENDSDCPPAYCRIRLPTAAVSLWGEFLNPSYFLRRDKVQTRLVELLANAAGSDTPNSSLHVDESILCGVPGKLVDAATLYHLLKVPSFQHIYYGPGGSMPRFPDPRDFRIAIVDEPEGIRLKIEFLSPAFANTCLNIRLLVAVGVDAWPSSSKFPHRISMAHCDCLLYHKAATTGMYLVGYGVQSSAWQIRVPAAENTILNHYSESSTIRTILDILYDSIEEIEISRNLKKHQISYKILNKYIMLTVLLEELEKSSSNPLNDLISWSPIYLSSIVLKLLEKLMSSLVQQMLPNYFFENSNLMVNPGHLSEDDFILEANNIKMYLVKLFDESMKPLSGDRDFNKMIQIQESEITLLCKWRELIQGMLPQFSRRGRGFCFVRFQNRQDSLYTQYTKNQLEYISLVLKSVLDVRQNILTTNNDLVKHNFNTEDTEVQHVMEDIIYLIILLMDQAKALYLNPSENSTLPKKKSKAKSQYNQCTTKFIELIRKDQSIKSLDIEDDLVMVKTILKWLYTAMDYNKRYLSLVLKPFLSKIFETSFAISWHLDSIKETSNRDELESLGHFCKLVNSYEITPAQGLIDASNKNWIWAKDILEMVDKHTLRIVFVSDRGKVIRHILSLPSYKKRETSQSVGCSRSGSKRSTLPNRSYFNTIMRKVISVLSIGIFINNVLYIAILSAFGSLLFFLIVLLTPDLEHSNRGWRMGCLLGFAGFSGIGLTNLFREVYKEDPTLLVTALLETGLIFSCLSACAIFSERGRFLFLGIPLTVFLFTLILISYANVIEESYAVSKALVYLSLFAMCGLVLYDTQVIVERFKNGDKDFIGQTMNVFTDFIGIYRRLLILAVDKQRQLEYRRVGSREDEEYFFGLVTPVAPIHALF